MIEGAGRLLLRRRRHRGVRRPDRPRRPSRLRPRGDHRLPRGRGVHEADDRRRARPRARRRLRADARLRPRRRGHDRALRAARDRRRPAAGAGGRPRPLNLTLHALKHMIFTGAVLEAEDAMRVGLVNEVVPEGGHGARAADWADAIAARSPLALATARRCSRPRAGSGFRTRSTRSRCSRERGRRRGHRGVCREARARLPRPMSDRARRADDRRAGRRAGAAPAPRHSRWAARSGSSGTTRAAGSTARERLDLLVDEGSFFEVGLLADAQFRRDERAPQPTPSSAASAGSTGGKVCVLAVDATVMAGTTAPGEHAQAEPARGVRRAQGAPARLPERQRRRPDPRRDGLALLGPAVRLRHVRAGAARLPRDPAPRGRGRRELRRLGAPRLDGALRGDDRAGGDRARPARRSWRRRSARS